MTTVVIDPLGTPEPLFLRSGIAVLDIVAGFGGPGGQLPDPIPTPIPLVSDHLIVRLSGNPNTNNAVELPANAPVGVLVEVYAVEPFSLVFHAASGDDIGSTPSAAVGGLDIWFRKVTPTNWRIV